MIPGKALDAASEELSQQLFGCPWSELNDQTGHAIAWDANRILEAAAPALRPHALRDEAEHLRSLGDGAVPGVYQAIAEYLEARAVELETVTDP